MGKAAKRRKTRRLEFLAELVTSQPERFRREWNKRMDSWLQEAWKRAGKSMMPPVFELVNEARRLLVERGVSENKLEDSYSIDVLINECCKALSSNIDGRLYRLNVKFKKR